MDPQNTTDDTPNIVELRVRTVCSVRDDVCLFGEPLLVSLLDEETLRVTCLRLAFAKEK